MAEEEKAAPLYVVPPVQRAFLLLRYIAAGNRCLKLSQVVADTGLNRTTLIRLLQTLVNERALEKRADGYHLGIGLISLAGDALFAHDIVEHARPVLERLAHETRLSSHLGVLDGHEIVYLLKSNPNSHLISNVRVGTRLPSYATTIGRILLGAMPESELRELLLDVNFTQYTVKTAPDIDHLISQVAEDRKIGLAWSYSNFEKGLGSCAAAVFDRSGRAVAGVNVTGHESHFATNSPTRERIGKLVAESANTLSALLGNQQILSQEARRNENG